MQHCLVLFFLKVKTVKHDSTMTSPIHLEQILFANHLTKTSWFAKTIKSDNLLQNNVMSFRHVILQQIITCKTLK